MDLEKLKNRMISSIVSFKEELSSLRTGRASTSLLDTIAIENNGCCVPIRKVSSITVSNSRTLSIEVWDKSMLNSIEKSIRDSKLGLYPIINGKNIRIILPSITEERRKSLVKISHDHAENARIAIRHIRREGMDILKKNKKDGLFGRDEIRNFSEKIQKLTDDSIAKIDEILSLKEQEILKE